MKRLIQRLISLFKTGGKRKNGSIIVKDLAYATKLKTITNWQYTNPALYKTWLVFPKKQQISYLRQIRQGKMTTDQLEKQIQAYEDIISPAKFNFTVKHGIKFSAKELSAIDNVAERLANAINNKENMLRYPNGFNITLPTEFTIRSSKATRGPIQMRREPGSGKYKPTPSNMAFPEGIATEQAKIMIDSWAIVNNESVKKETHFDPMIPNQNFLNERSSINNNGASKDDYQKYGWLFGGIIR